ncbi:MAG: HAMP domain-containing histidine kinase [Nitrospirota bacterium]|nr:HAMP domain-containing histidine kinase [Nitrospirota bacterium]
MMRTLTENALTSAVGSLIDSADSVSSQSTVNSVAERFFGNTELEALAVVDSDEPVGLVTRTKLMFSLFRRYGFELYGKRPITAVADARPLIVPESERLDVVIERALERRPQDIYDEIIVIDDGGRYRGLLSVKHLVVQQSNALAQTMLQREMASERARELERENAMRSQFMAHVTHELRSPVNVIIGLSELMHIALDKGSIDQVRDRLGSIISNATNLRTIVTNVLDLSKLEANKMPVSLRSFDLADTVREVAEAARVLVRAKPVVVEVSIPATTVPIESDPVKVRQILMNLAGNAAKFTERGSIMLALSLSGHSVTVSVIDTGIGIRTEHLDRLFLAFSQIEDAKTKRHEGTGLGLMIARSMARLLGGDLDVASEAGQGSTFTITLPRRAAQEEAKNA